MSTTYVPLLLLATCTVVMVWPGRQARRRAQTPDHRARPSGLAVASRDALGLLHRYCDLRLMQTGHHRRVIDVTSGTEAAGRLTVFTVAWEIGMATERQVVRRTAVVIETIRDRPGLYFSRRSPLEPVGAFRSYSRVRIPAGAAGAPGEAALFVETPWKPALTEPMMRWLLDRPAEWTFECRRRFVAGYGPVPRGSEQESHLVDAVRTLAERLDQAVAEAGLDDDPYGNIL